MKNNFISFFRKPKGHSIRLDAKRLRRIPQKSVCLWFAVLGFIILLLVNQFMSYPPHVLDNAKKCNICIDEIKLRDTYRLRGSRMKLEITSQGVTYYLGYPQGKYLNFSQNIKSDLLSGNITEVQATSIGQRTLYDHIFNRQYIVELKSDTAVYYDIETETAQMWDDYIGVWFVIAILLVAELIYTLYLLLMYNVLVSGKPKGV